MILALDRFAALFVFESADDACSWLEAIDVKQDAFEFCDDHGQRYSPTYTRQPSQSSRGFLGSVDIGAFRLDVEGVVDIGLPKEFVTRARHIEHSSIQNITDIDTLRKALEERS